MRPSPAATARLVAAVVLLVPLAGCAVRVPVAPAPYAGDPVCAEVVLALPLELGDLERLRTDSQASVAWGDPTHPIVLRCGVEPPGPSTDQCVTAEDDRSSVDWVAVPGEADETGASDWTFTTYGRSPAIEVFVPAEVTESRSTSFLVELGPAIEQVRATRHCV